MHASASLQNMIRQKYAHDWSLNACGVGIQSSRDRRLLITERLEFFSRRGLPLTQHSPKNYFGENFCDCYNNNNNMRACFVHAVRWRSAQSALIFAYKVLSDVLSEGLKYTVNELIRSYLSQSLRNQIPDKLIPRSEHSLFLSRRMKY